MKHQFIYVNCQDNNGHIFFSPTSLETQISYHTYIAAIVIQFVLHMKTICWLKISKPLLRYSVYSLKQISIHHNLSQTSSHCYSPREHI